MDYSDWAGLPKHLLDIILQKLESSKDYLRFSIVCLSWHSITKENQIKLSCHHQVPMLLIPSDENDHTWSTYDVMENKFLEVKLIVPYHKRFCGSSEGWLIAVNEDWTVTLHQPYYSFDNEGRSCTADTSIHLPCLFPPEIDDEMDGFDQADGFIDVRHIFDYHVDKAIITADPVTKPNECTVVVIYGDLCEIAFMRLGKDTKWTKIDSKDYVLADDILHYDNQLYILSFLGTLTSVGITDSCISTVKVALELPHENTMKRYIIKSYEGELLQVERHFDWSKDKARKTTKFKVFRPDCERRRWIEINSLGDITLFLGDNSSISVLASNFIGCQPNCIYFTHDVDCVHGSTNPIICDLGVYDLGHKSFRLHYTTYSDALKKMSRRPPIWVVPLLNA